MEFNSNTSCIIEKSARKNKVHVAGIIPIGGNTVAEFQPMRRLLGPGEF